MENGLKGNPRPLSPSLSLSLFDSEGNVREPRMPAFVSGSGAAGELGGGERKAKERRHSRPGGGRRRRKAAAAENPDLFVRYSSSDHHSGVNCSGVGSFLSSAAGSSAGDRCSFGSDRDALVPQIALLHLAGREQSSGGPGPDTDPEKRAAPYPSFPFPDTFSPTPHHDHPSSKRLNKEPKEDLLVPLEKEGEEEEVEEETLDPTKHSFSHALRDCQNRRVRSEVHPLPGRKSRRRRPASLDLNGEGGADVAVLSPRFFVGGVGGMKKSSATSSRSRSGTFPSPGTPNYRFSAGAMGYQKGWSSERVPLPANSSRRHVGSGALLPFNNGRTLPSKWEDAEKWIFSPVSGDGFGRSSVPPPHHRRPKSKSGPLGPPGGMGRGYASASPLVPYFDSVRVGHFGASSPFLAGVLMPERGCCGNGNNGRSGGGGGGGGEGAGGTGGGSYSTNAESYILRSASVHGWSDALIESSSSLPSSQGTVQDEKLERTREESTMISSLVLKKDVATQMSPEGSTPSSPKARLSFSPSPSALPTEELESHFSKLEIRDVQVDDRVTVTRWSKKHIARGADRHSMNIVEWKKKTVEAKASSWDVGETAKCMSTCGREEAKIAAWENLQKAKAEAEIRKLEMNLEKKRSSSMDKILNKLKSAQRKAQEMRSAVTASQTNQVARTNKKLSYFRKPTQISSLSGCFTCHAF